jgi:phenylacetate-coenzyme A ligase PaaK-like adenylate-forming protein
MNFPSIDSLCSRKEAFDFSDSNESLFIDAMVENYRFQYTVQPFIRHLAHDLGITPDAIKGMKDVLGIPPLFVGTMKLDSFCSVSADEIELVLTSSGTAGQKTQAFFDKGSLLRLRNLAGSCFDALSYRSSIPAHSFLMSYDISRASNVGTSWSDEEIMSLAPVLSSHWVIEWDDKTGGFSFDAEKWAKKFVDLAADAPVRMLGFPAFMYRLIEEVIRIEPHLLVKPDSFIVAGGGWKNHLGTPMTHKTFARFVEDSIGLPFENVRDTFGMAEHGVPYCSCKAGYHHVPIFGRLVARDPLSMQDVGYGREGMLQLLTPYNTAQPNLSVLSSDLAVLRKDCPCGLPGVYIESVRRGGIKKHRGCAIAAQEILGKT